LIILFDEDGDGDDRTFRPLVGAYIYPSINQHSWKPYRMP
jgi:hypothetical protein